MTLNIFPVGSVGNANGTVGVLLEGGADFNPGIGSMPLRGGGENGLGAGGGGKTKVSFSVVSVGFKKPGATPPGMACKNT